MFRTAPLVVKFKFCVLAMLMTLATTFGGVGATATATVRTGERETLEHYVVRIRRELHKIPETCYSEHLTSAVIVRELEALGGDGGVEILARGVAGTGVVARFGNGSAPVTILRADIDALPVPEVPPSNLPSSLSLDVSTHAGRSHACGHDGHVAGAVQSFDSHAFFKMLERNVHTATYVRYVSIWKKKMK